MCESVKEGCQKPEKLKGKPGECSPEQIRECHGDQATSQTHPCTSATEKKE